LGRHGAVDFDREAELVALSDRLKASEEALLRYPAASRRGRLARLRMEVLLGEFELASRRWAIMPLPTDPIPSLAVDESLRRLIRTRLDSGSDIQRARRVLGEILAGRSPTSRPRARAQRKPVVSRVDVAGRSLRAEVSADGE